MREWYAEAADARTQRLKALTWARILECWDALETDFQSFYGIDLEDRVVRSDRSWRWFRVRVMRLLAEDTQLCRLLELRD